MKSNNTASEKSTLQNVVVGGEPSRDQSTTHALMTFAKDIPIEIIKSSNNTKGIVLVSFAITTIIIVGVATAVSMYIGNKVDILQNTVNTKFEEHQKTLRNVDDRHRSLIQFIKDGDVSILTKTKRRTKNED